VTAPTTPQAETATDEQIVAEAYRIYRDQKLDDPGPTTIAIRLVREGWKPVDPALQLARGAAIAANPTASPAWHSETERGLWDFGSDVRSALAMHAAMLAAGYSL
jgi:hypothetical protein